MLVIGVYPSAFHVRWWRPDSNSSRPTISSLAVDVEPVVFWNGTTPSPDDLLDRWITDVGFTETWGRVAPGLNGPSGQGLASHYLEPLGVDDTTTAYTDLIPWFFIKSGAKSQGDAINERFQPWATGNDAPLCSLPARPSSAALVDLARTTKRRESLRQEILDIHPQMILTLGQESLDGLRVVCDGFAPAQDRLAPDDAYGRPGRASIEGVEFDLIAAVHPGFLRQSNRTDWQLAHSRWASTTRS